MKIGAQMLDLDKLADEVLAKSMKADDKEDTSNPEVTPEDVSANIPDNDNEKPEETTAEEKEDREEPVKKSINAADEDKEGTKEETPVEPEEKQPETEESESEEAEDVEKSFKDNETIQKSIEASEFLETMVEMIVKSLSDTQTTLQKSQTNSQSALDILAKSLGANLRQGEAMKQQIEAGMQSLQKSISEQMDTMKSEILAELEEFSHQPASARKSVKNVNVQERDFHKSLGQPAGDMQLSKSEVMSILNSELYSGNTMVTPTDIISYESGAPLRPEIQRLVMSKH